MSATSAATSVGSFSTTAANFDCCEVMCLVWNIASSCKNQVYTFALKTGISSLMAVPVIGTGSAICNVEFSRVGIVGLTFRITTNLVYPILLIALNIEPRGQYFRFQNVGLTKFFVGGTSVLSILLVVLPVRRSGLLICFVD